MSNLYRVATSNNFDRTILNVQQRQQSVSQSQDQLSSGKRVSRASDDAVSASLAERSLNRQARTEADLRALEFSKRSLQQAESSLGTTTELMHRAKELIVQAGSGVLNDSDRRDIAAQLQGIREQLVSEANQADANGVPLFGGLGGANRPVVDVYGLPSSDVQFRGQRGQVAATDSTLPQTIDGYDVFMNNVTGNGTFTVAHAAGDVLASTGAVYDPGLLNANVFPHDFSASVTAQGSYTLNMVATGAAGSQQLELQVTRNNKTPPGGTALVLAQTLGAYQPGVPVELHNVSVGFEGIQVDLTGPAKPGDQFTIAPSQPDDIFSSLTRAVEALKSSGASNKTYTSQELARVNVEMDDGLDRIQLARGRLGDWLNRADHMNNLFTDRTVAYQKEQSELTDVDMVKAVSEFQSNQTAYQAALQSYAQIQKMSMFDYLR